MVTAMILIKWGALFPSVFDDLDFQKRLWDIFLSVVWKGVKLLVHNNGTNK